MDPLMPLYTSHSDPVKSVIAIDGGGVKGIIPACILAKIEEVTNCHIADLADCFGGTSAGAIVAAALVIPTSSVDRTPMYSAEQIVNFFKEKSETIFPPSYCSWFRDFISLFIPKYSPDGLYSVLEEQCQGLKMQDCLKDIVIPTANFTKMEPWWFTKDAIIAGSPNHECVKSFKTENILLADVLKITTSAPYYFPPADFSVEGIKYKGIDGGTFANNPAAIALNYAKALFGSEQKMLVGTFSTGKPTPPLPMPSANNSGGLFWLFNYPSISMQLTNGEAQLLTCVELNSNISNGAVEKNLFNFAPLISEEDYNDLDDSSPKHLDELISRAEEYIDDNTDLINKYCRQLLLTRERKILVEKEAENVSSRT